MGRIPKVEKERALEEEKVKDGDEAFDDGHIKTLSTSSGFSSDQGETNPLDDTRTDPEAVSPSQRFHKIENGTQATSSFPQYTTQGYGPVYPCEQRDDLGSVRSRMKTSGPVPMDHSGAYTGSQIPLLNSMKLEGHLSSDHQVSQQNGMTSRDHVPDKEAAYYSEPRVLEQNGLSAGKHVPMDNLAKSNAPDMPDRIGMKFGRPAPKDHPSLCNGAGEPASREQFSSWSKTNLENGSGSANTTGTLRDESAHPRPEERGPGVRSPGMTPTSVYNSEVIKQLFTHALENICQDGMKAQLMEKFLQIDASKCGGGSMDSSVVNNPPTRPGPEEHVQDVSTRTGSIIDQSYVPTSFKNCSSDQERQAQNDADLSTGNKMSHTSAGPVYLTSALPSGSKLEGPRQPNPLGSYGMHKLPPTLPQLSTMMKPSPLRPSHNRIPSTVVSSSQGISNYPSHSQPMDPRSSDWYEQWSDTIFADRDTGKMSSNKKQYVENTKSLAQQRNTCENIKIKREPGTEFQNTSCPYTSTVQNTNSNANVFYGQPPKAEVFLENDFRGNACGGGRGSVNTKTDRSYNDIQIIESIFSDIATSSQSAAEGRPRHNSPTVPPNTEDWLHDINIEVLDDENLWGEELVYHLEKWYLKIEALSLSMIKTLHDGIKDGTYMVRFYSSFQKFSSSRL
jgi:hypothetical protein